jgi:chaperone BCS1
MVLDRPFSTILPGEEAGEDSSRGITQLPANILEAFIPGYGVISQFLFEVLGFDITIAVSVCFLIFGLATSIRYLWLHASEFFKTYFMSSISIESDDDVYEQVMDWLGDQKVSRESLGLIARTGKHSWDIDDEGACGDNSLSQGKWLNFSNWESKIPPKFQPCFGRHKFWYKGRYFELGREMKPALVSIRWSGMRAEEILRLSCVGRSTQPIKNLIMECQSRYFNKRSSRTTVRRPATKEIRSYGRNPWGKCLEQHLHPSTYDF